MTLTGGKWEELETDWMLELEAQEWKDFHGGYKIPYDASIPLHALELSVEPDERIWDELWENLYHQGDTGLASYASIPHIFRIYRGKGWMDVHLPNFASAVADSRQKGKGPEVPDWLETDFRISLIGTAQYCLTAAGNITDKNFSRAVLMLVAVLMRDDGAYSLLDQITIGDEERLIELYNEHG